MSKLGHGLTTLSILGAMSAALSGCPVWSEGSAMGSGDGGVITLPDVPPPPPPPPPPRTCTTDAQCANGYCNPTTRLCVNSPACSAAVACPSAFYCDPRGVCIPGCSSNAECTTVASGLVCDTTTRRCAPSGGCTADAQCASTPTTPVCLGGSCQPRSNLCQFDYQCTGSGQSCVDGRCVVGCTAATASRVCAAGQVCTSNRCAYPSSSPSTSCPSACATGQLCVSGVCLRTCNADPDCGAGNMCDHGVCRVDTRPRPFCTDDTGCNAGSICYNGACRLLCPMGTASECMMVDDHFDLCRSDMMGRSLCTSTNEVTPQCARSADCTAGRQCVNARCQ